jgi:hypothetical protein
MKVLNFFTFISSSREKFLANSDQTPKLDLAEPIQEYDLTKSILDTTISNLDTPS